jgi:hypothetical protein
MDPGPEAWRKCGSMILSMPAYKKVAPTKNRSGSRAA